MDNNRDEVDISKMKVADLKKELKIRGLSTAGNKTELMDRLQDALRFDSEADLYDLEDANNGETDELIDEDAVLQEDTDTVKLDTHFFQSSASKPNIVEIEIQPETKDVLRKVVSDNNTDDMKNEEKHLNGSLTNKINICTELTKLPTAISVEERLKIRAKRFNTESTDETKKILRAQRFGLKNSTQNQEKEKLEKRAERFGMKQKNMKIDQSLLKKREERFGVVSDKNKKADRLKRFGSSIDSLLTEEQKLKKTIKFGLI